MAKSTPKKAKVKKPKKYKYFVINIKIRYTDSTEDIPEHEYRRLFREFYLSGTVGKSSQQKECILISFAPSQPSDTQPFFWGQFVQVTNLNNKKWFNKRSKALETGFKVPPDFAANASITEYVFIPAAHRFCYINKSSDYIQPYAAKRYFIEALNKFLGDGYVVDVDVESDRVTIDRIYEAPEVRRLYLKINYSNNDFSKEMQEFVENELRLSNVGELEINAKQKDNNSIDIHSSTILTGALEASVSNGEAEAIIVDFNGKQTRVNTKNNPLRLVVTANEDDRPLNVYNTVMNEYRNPEN